ncbi:hypothetical protein H0I39_11070 [Ottowia beijingensis]|uniref:DUF7657 domain-containing protein n=1 Tax=Ottowia beijingensis TaxID=1207057 RepID=A0A853ING4_9BURK|nr:hypothetical protein [Ottowia beijingensis]NZA02153.1 hypothetical protein [Ottowia beijingensis]
MLGFAAFALGFQFLGYPAWLTRLTLWNVVTVYRLDLALGVAQLVLLGWLMAQPRAATGLASLRVLALAMALLTAAYALWANGRMPLDVADGLPAGFVLLSALTAAAAAYLLVLQRWRVFLVLYLGWMLAAVLPFHPWGRRHARSRWTARWPRPASPKPSPTVPAAAAWRWWASATGP